MTEQEFKEILHKEETDTVEFKSWVNARNMKEIISLAVDAVSYTHLTLPTTSRV